MTDGTPIEFTTQVGDKITKMLLAVRRMTESGNMVIFGANLKSIRKLAALDKIEPNLIVGKNGKKSEIVDKDGMYTYPIKIKRKHARETLWTWGLSTRKRHGKRLTNGPLFRGRSRRGSRKTKGNMWNV
jgi:hypothetical protein